MNILYIDHYAGSDKMGMEFRPFYMAREWARLGHDVTILAADYSHLRAKNPEVPYDFFETVEEGVRFSWIKTPRYIGNRVRRIRNMYAFIGKLSRFAGTISRKYNPDVVINSSTYPMDVYPAVKIARINGAATCYEIHDIWPMSLMVLGSRPKWEPAMQVVQMAENYCYKNCDTVVSVLPDANRHIKEIGFDKVDFHYIPNGVFIEPQAACEPLGGEWTEPLSRLKSEGKFIVMYAGGHALSNALWCFIDSADTLPDGCTLVLVGNGSEKPELIKRANGRKNIVFLDSVKKRCMHELLGYADVLYLGAKKSPLYSYGVGMNKLYDYMLAARPIIYGVGSSNRPVEEAHCGITVEPEDPKAISEAVGLLMKTPREQLAVMGKNGYDYVVKNHDYKVLADRFLRILEDTADNIRRNNKNSRDL